MDETREKWRIVEESHVNGNGGGHVTPSRLRGLSLSSLQAERMTSSDNDVTSRRSSAVAFSEDVDEEDFGVKVKVNGTNGGVANGWGRGGEGGATLLTDTLLEGLISALRCHDCYVPGQNGPIRMSEHCQATAERIAKLEESCDNLSAEFDRCAVSSSGNHVTNGQPIKRYDMHDEMTALRMSWAGIRRLLYCADVHLGNASRYQQFYYETEELQRQLDAYSSQCQEQLTEEAAAASSKASSPSAAVQRDAKQAQDMLTSVMTWEAQADSVCDRSRTVVPVHRRLTGLADGETGMVRALCSYATKEISVSEGEHLVLLEAGNGSSGWKVKNRNGKVGHLPAVCLLMTPPDDDAIQAARKLAKKLAEAVNMATNLLSKLLASNSADLFGDFSDNRKYLFRHLTSDHKRHAQMTLADLEAFFIKNFPHLCGPDTLLDKVKRLVDSATIGPEDANFHSQVIAGLQALKELADIYAKMLRTADLAKRRLQSLGGDDSIDDVDHVTQEQASVSMSVQKESTTVSHGDSITNTSGEQRQTFSIRSVRNTLTGAELSIMDAIIEGILKPQTGTYVNLATGDEMPIPAAMTAGFIAVEASETRQIREKRQGVGLVDVTVYKETRPYTVRRVLDPRRSPEVMVGVEEAIREGLFERETGRYRNPTTGTELGPEEAISQGVLEVEYDAEAAPMAAPSSEVTTKTLAVYEALDRASGDRLQFHEACERDIVDVESGQYTDTLTGNKVNLFEAYRRGWVKAKVIEDRDSFDLASSGDGGRGRSGSGSSSGSSSVRSH